MPVVKTKGAASSQGFGEFAKVGGPPVYIEDVFSTYLYTGNSTSGGTQTVTNNIDLSTNGGMVWIKGRSAASNNVLFDTTRGAGASATNNNALSSNLTTAEDLGGSAYDYLSSFSTTGFVVTQGGTTAATRGTNYNNVTYASWTFRKQPKFFDVVTWTGDGNATKTISHNLGSVPGCIFVKITSGVNGWDVYHQSLGTSQYVQLNTTATATTISNVWGTITSTTFTATGTLGQNDSGATYVAYLFAHNAGGFGLTGTDNVVSCGSFTQASGGTTVNLGFEPQLVLVKCSSSAGNWFIFDNMRGNTQTLYPNLANAEGDQGAGSFQYNATGFTMADYITGSVGSTIIYIAIRRGPMKTPTSGTSVYNAVARTGTGATAVVNTTITADAFLIDRRNSAGNAWGELSSRLTGASKSLWTTQTYAEITDTTEISNIGMDSITLGTSATVNSSAGTYINWFFKRAPSFMDVVCYAGTGAARTVAHNLGVAPELIIEKCRNAANTQGWQVYAASQGASKTAKLNSTAAFGADGNFGAAPTSTVFSINGADHPSGETYVAYLFASCPGVSKVGSYTGTGTTKQIDCGFTGGARFVLVKATSTTGDWLVWDSARGIVAGNDPYLALNSTAAEVTTTDWVDTYSAGFELSNASGNLANTNGTDYIFLAVS